MEIFEIIHCSNDIVLDVLKNRNSANKYVAVNTNDLLSVFAYDYGGRVFLGACQAQTERNLVHTLILILKQNSQNDFKYFV